MQRHATDQDVVEQCRSWQKPGLILTFQGGLNTRCGYHTGPPRQRVGTKRRVKNLRLYHNIPVFAKCCELPWLNKTNHDRFLHELTVNVGFIRTMVKHVSWLHVKLLKGRGAMG